MIKTFLTAGALAAARSPPRDGRTGRYHTPGEGGPSRVPALASRHSSRPRRGDLPRGYWRQCHSRHRVRLRPPFVADARRVRSKPRPATGPRRAMFMGAQSNDFGMVGLWPHARILSVQSNLPGQDVVPIGAYIAGINRCDTKSGLHGIKVIVVALSTETITDWHRSRRTSLTPLLTARHHGMNVVVAGGNNDGRPVGHTGQHPWRLLHRRGRMPAAPVSSVRRRVRRGALLLAPGCGVDGADTSNRPVPQTGSARYECRGRHRRVRQWRRFRTWRPDLAPDVGRTSSSTETASRRQLTDVDSISLQPSSQQGLPAPSLSLPPRLHRPPHPLRRHRGDSVKTPAVASARRRTREADARLTIRERQSSSAGTTLTMRVYRVAARSRCGGSRQRHAASSKLVAPGLAADGQHVTGPVTRIRPAQSSPARRPSVSRRR